MLKKTTFREIKSSLGRYLAILAIVALGVGFFSGLKISREAMVRTAGSYLDDHSFFDYKVVSTLGFEKKDAKALAEEDYIDKAEATISKDVLASIDGSSDMVVMTHTMPEDINQIVLTEGRLPEKSDECVIDARIMDRDVIGKKLVISDANVKDTKKMYSRKEYTITGLVVSPYYLNFERGTTSLGTGNISGFAFFPEDAFDTDYYTEIFLTLSEKHPLYSDEYEDLVDRTEDKVEAAADKRADRRYREIVDDAEKELEKGQKKYNKNRRKYLNEKADTEAELADSWNKIQDGKREIANGKAELRDKRKELNDGKAQVNAGFTELEKSRAEFEAGKPYMTPEQIAATETALAQTEAELNGKLSQINSGLEQVEAGFDRIDSSERELNRNISKYYDGKAEADREFRKAEKKLNDAKKDLKEAREEIDDIEAPDVFVLGRDTNIGYACFESDVDIVDGISQVFPVFFFLVAALVCMTTMTRMVDEQRTQIGVLKALGYSNGAVIGKYMFYSGSASFAGCVIGFLAGCYIFPMVIWQAYHIMYDFSADLFYVLDGKLAAVSLFVSLLCSMGATLISCYSEFREVPAQLIRPKAPKNGKRILLERIPFIWNKISFLYKVSFRNVFRYKKRFLMMVLGISGCTALLVTGFGLRDSIKNIADFQFEEIQTFEYQVMFDREMTEKRQDAFVEKMGDKADDIIFVHQGSCDLVAGKEVKSVNLVVSDNDNFGDFVNLHTVDGKEVSYPGKGEIVVCKKLSDKYNLKAGSKVVLRDEDMNEMELTVSDVVENYIYNYVYVAPESLEDGWGYAPEIKAAYVNTSGDVHASSAKALDANHVAAVTVNDDLRSRVDNMMKSLDYVVALVIVSAAALAFIVLYNLTNINITERIREIATIKVLGFYPNETSAYVFRENGFLAIISAIVGLGLGKWLHSFVMNQINIDMISFDIRVTPLSYLLSVVLTLVFAFIVNIAMSGKLSKISMTESLKSIE